VKDFSILQVEDTENDVILMKYAFKQAGIANALSVVRDGQQAIDYLAGVGEYADREKYPLPGLVLLDLKLPRKMGLDVLKWIRENPSLDALPVIVLTSSGQRDDVQNAYRTGANSFLIKPSGVKELVELLKAVKVYWLEYNEAPSERHAGVHVH
jgi:CheY-like chemotaxis protein